MKLDRLKHLYDEAVKGGLLDENDYTGLNPNLAKIVKERDIEELIRSGVLQAHHLNTIKNQHDEDQKRLKVKEDEIARNTARQSSQTRMGIYIAMLSLSFVLIVSTTAAINSITISSSNNHTDNIIIYGYLSNGSLASQPGRYSESIAMGFGILSQMLTIAPIFGIISVLLLSREIYFYLLTYALKTMAPKNIAEKLFRFTVEYFILIVASIVFVFIIMSWGVYLRAVFTMGTSIITASLIPLYMLYWIVYHFNELFTEWQNYKRFLNPITYLFIALLILTIILYATWFNYQLLSSIFFNYVHG